MDYIRRIPRRSAAPAPRFGRVAYRNRHNSRGRPAAHRSQRPATPPQIAPRRPRHTFAPFAKIANCENTRRRFTRIYFLVVKIAESKETAKFRSPTFSFAGGTRPGGFEGSNQKNRAQRNSPRC